MVLHSGKLRERIAIKKPVRTRNPSGGYQTTYATVLTTYAEVVEKTASADLIASQENVNNLVEFNIRHREDVDLKNGYRIEWRGFVFTLNRFKVDMLRTKITIIANSEIETTSRNEPNEPTT